jgi:hypothetical protein
VDGCAQELLEDDMDVEVEQPSEQVGVLLRADLKAISLNHSIVVRV